MTDTDDTHMTEKASSTAFATKVQELYGGYDGFDRALRARVDEFHSVWNQDSESIGRILRCHLGVEHFLTRVIEVMNPNLGSLTDARVSFSQKLDLVDPKNPIVHALLPGLRRLNQVRNRMAHRLRGVVTDADRDALLAIPFFSVAYGSGMSPCGPQTSEPIGVLEQFSEFAASMLYTLCAPGKAEFDAVVTALTKVDDESRPKPEQESLDVDRGRNEP